MRLTQRSAAWEVSGDPNGSTREGEGQEALFRSSCCQQMPSLGLQGGVKKSHPRAICTLESGAVQAWCRRHAAPPVIGCYRYGMSTLEQQPQGWNQPGEGLSTASAAPWKCKLPIQGMGLPLSNTWEAGPGPLQQGLSCFKASSKSTPLSWGNIKWMRTQKQFPLFCH